MACPLNATTGFQILQGQITTSILDKITVPTSPGTISFMPRQIPPTLINGNVEESDGNTINIKGITYTLISTQICQPTHRGGFQIPGQQKTPELELVLTCFKKPVSANSNNPAMVLLIIPIYSSNQESNGGYINQLLDSDQPAANLQSIFYQTETDLRAKSIQYNLCIDLVNPANFNTKTSLSTLVLYFPMGCTVTLQTIANLKAKEGLTDYRIPPAILQPYATVMTYSVELDGSKTPSSISSEGYVPTTLIQASSEQFGNLFEYHEKPPALASKFNESACPYYQTTQYKCVPFDKVKDLSGNYVIPENAQTLSDKLEVQNQIRANEVSTGITLSSLGTGFGILIAIVVGICLLFFLIAWLNGSTPDQLRAAAAAAAMRAASAGGTPPE